MHYYQHNIGDYRRDTSHLSLLEHGIYRTLLDLYYLNEAPIPKETEWVIRRLSAKTNDEVLAIQAVLKDFFIEGVDGYKHKRCDMEIREYTAKAETARHNGKSGGRPKKTQPVILGNPDITQVKANHKPLTINQEPLGEGESATRIPPSFQPKTEPGLEFGIDLSKELANFRDYWTAKAGKDAIKLDWQAEWRRWLRKVDKPVLSRFEKPDPAITVPGKTGRDPEIEKAERDQKNRATPSAETLAAIARIKQGAAA